MQCSKEFTLTVNDLVGCLITSPAALPDETGWEFYSYQILAAGGTPPYTFAITVGSITGGSMDAAGLISAEFHNPNLIPVTSLFTVECTDSAGIPNICSKDFSLTCVHATDCPTWANISWGDGTPFFTPNLTTGDSFTGACNGVAGGVHGGSIGATLYAAGCTKSELQWTWNVDAAGGTAEITITSSLQGILVSRTKNPGSFGSETRKFALQPGIHTLSVGLNIASGGGSTTMNGTILNS